MEHKQPFGFTETQLHHPRGESGSLIGGTSVTVHHGAYTGGRVGAPDRLPEGLDTSEVFLRLQSVVRWSIHAADLGHMHTCLKHNSAQSGISTY